MTLCFQLDGFLEPACLIRRCDAESIDGCVEVTVAAVAAAPVAVVVAVVGRSQEDVCVLSFQ